MTRADFDFVRALLRKHAAIVLEDEKVYLAESRLLPVARRQGFDTLDALVARLRADRFNGLHTKVIEAMTTNETSFFRDIKPFEALRHNVLPDLIQRRAAKRTLNIWCAASSTGQEPYTLAMLIREHFPALSSWLVRFLATDLSTEVLDRARAGFYSQLEVNRGMPSALLVKYFDKDGVNWRIKDDIRRMVEFRPLNLIETWSVSPPIDIVLIRNVLIYFNTETRAQILTRIRTLLQPDGYLFLGGAETTLGIDDNFIRLPYERAGCHQLRPK